MPAFPELCDELAIVDRDLTEGQERIARQAEVVRERHTQAAMPRPTRRTCYGPCSRAWTR